MSALSRFMNEMVGISLSTFEKLAPELGLRVVRETPADAFCPPPSERLETAISVATGTKASGKKRRKS